MTQVWNVLDRLDGEATIRIDDERRVSVAIRVDDVSRQELLRVAQHLLEAAGASTIEAVMAIGSLTFEQPGSVPYAGHGARYALDLERARMSRARTLLEENRADGPAVPEETIPLLYRQGVVPSEIAEVMGWRLSSVIALLENLGVMDE